MKAHRHQKMKIPTFSMKLLKREKMLEMYNLRVQAHAHHRVKVNHHGFRISKTSPFLGASVDNVRSCEWNFDCNDIVEYKCPFKHKLLDPKEAFVTLEVGGRFPLKSTTQYYQQVQMQMYVLELLSFDFLVWTTKAIFCVETRCL